jgi:hypothetical protein
MLVGAKAPGLVTQATQVKGQEPHPPYRSEGGGEGKQTTSSNQTFIGYT